MIIFYYHIRKVDKSATIFKIINLQSDKIRQLFLADYAALNADRKGMVFHIIQPT